MCCRDERGQGTVLAALGTLILVLLVAGMVDLARLWAYRTWGYRIAESAALAGLANSRDYTDYMATGEISLDATVAYQDAGDALQAALAQHSDLTHATYDIRVHEIATTTVYAGYPPVPRAGMVSGDWAPDSPAVGVYLEFAVQPVLYGWVNGNQTIPIHVFAAASVVEAH
jgi:Flp pilus assembly protein TadG